MRRRAAVDANQPEVVKALRKAGATVLHMHTLGKGAPDLLVGYAGHNIALELKDGSKPPSARKLTEDEQEWHDAWRGQVCTVKSVDEALDAIFSIAQFGRVTGGKQ